MKTLHLKEMCQHFDGTEYWSIKARKKTTWYRVQHM